jgi:hypothetical protein
LVETALGVCSAKIWVSETDRDDFGLIDGENQERLRVTRWEQNEALRDNDRSWRWTPARGDIEIKSAVVNRDGKDWIPPEKKDRGEQNLAGLSSTFAMRQQPPPLAGGSRTGLSIIHIAGHGGIVVYKAASLTPCGAKSTSQREMLVSFSSDEALATRV